MNSHIRTFSKCAAMTFVVMVVIAFTPLNLITMLFTLPTLGWNWFLGLLLFLCAPFGGFLFIAIEAPKSKWANQVAVLAGFWVGALTGAPAGFYLVSAL